MISFKNIRKSYGSRTVLDNVSLDIPKGKITALIGSNGSGKSTLLSIISRLIPKDGGEVWVDGKNIEAYKSKMLARRLSVLRQSHHINLKLTVQELVSFGRFPYSQGKLSAADQEKISDALQYLHLESIRDQYIDELSGGQQQRAFMAMVIAQDTDYILLDEPLNNLDMKHAVQIMKTLFRLSREQNKTILIVIHEINFAAQYADHIIALKDAGISYFGPTEEIMRPQVLQDIFDMSFEIIDINDKKFCNYFNASI